MTQTIARPTCPSARTSLLDAFERTRRFSERLCAPLEVEDYVVQTMPEVSPVKWHLAHTTWFFERFILSEHVAGYVPLQETYWYLFNSYYNAAGPMHCRHSRGLLSRPTVAEVYAYREAIDQRMSDLLTTCDEAALAVLGPLVTLGVHHEQQHQELIVTDVKHIFSSNPLLPAYRAPEAGESPAPDAADAPGTPGTVSWVGFAGGVREIGVDEGAVPFCYDNETPRHKVYVQDFELADRLSTSGDYMRFIEDGGYQRPELWLSLGWQTVTEQGWTHPLYWYRDRDNRWLHYTLAGPRPVDPAEPVSHLSYFEADAFARWSGVRLPTEAEWEVAAAGTPIEGNFAESGRLHPQIAPGNRPSGEPEAISGLFGDLWEWTQSPYVAYPGYRPLPGALGEYNGKFMCNQFVLRGGSCATPRSHLRATYRNFFAPQTRWQFSGVRLAR